jgi:putative membrane protein
MWWYGIGMGWGGWLGMGFTMVAFWGLVIFAVVAIFRSTSRSGDQSRPGRTEGTHQDPSQILDERFARGEIDAEEYRARQEVLRPAAR